MVRYQIYIECLYPFSNSFNLRTEVIHIYFKMTDNSNASTSAVSVKAPQFDETAATRWFQIIESQFVLANVSVPSTKFHIAFSNLPVLSLLRLATVLLLMPPMMTLKRL